MINVERHRFHSDQSLVVVWIGLLVMGSMALAATNATAQQGNGILANVDTEGVHFVLRQRGALKEHPIDVQPGAFVRLRKHLQYELFLPDQAIVFDVDATSTGSEGGPWQQQVYCLFRNENGSWNLGKGFVEALRMDATRQLRQMKQQLDAKWIQENDQGNGRRVDANQMRFCQSFMLEAFFRRRLEMPVRIHPMEPNAGHSSSFIVEAQTCHPVPAIVQQSVAQLVRDAFEEPAARVDFETTCADQAIRDEVWDSFVAVCSQVNRQKEQARLIDQVPLDGSQSSFQTVSTGSFFGIDGSGSDLDIAAQRYASLLHIRDGHGDPSLAGVSQPVEDEIRLLVGLALQDSADTWEKRQRSEARINAHYGCSFLYRSDPTPIRSAVTLNSHPIIDFSSRAIDGSIVMIPPSYHTVTKSEFKRLRRVQVTLDGWEKLEYRPRGYCMLLDSITDAAKRARMSRIFDVHWKDLPIGGDVGHHFELSNEYCIRVRSPDAGKFKVFDFMPSSNRSYLVTANALKTGPFADDGLTAPVQTP